MRSKIVGTSALSLLLGSALLLSPTATAQTAPPANGVEVDRASYSQDAAGATVLDVFARSAADQQVSVSGPGIPPTALQGQGGRYYARVALPAGTAVPATVQVVNATDEPDTTREAPVTDVVTVTRASYSPESRTLTVAATTSDLAAPPILTAAGFGPVTAAGTVFPGVVVPPATVTVASAAGGADTEPVTVTAAAAPADALRVTEARYRARDREWRVEGTSTAPVGTVITIHLGADLRGAVLATVRVDSDREWEFRESNSARPAAPFVSVSSAAGGSVLAVPVTDED